MRATSTRTIAELFGAVERRSSTEEASVLSGPEATASSSSMVARGHAQQHVVNHSHTNVNIFARAPARRSIVCDEYDDGESDAEEQAEVAATSGRATGMPALAPLERERAKKRKLPEGPRGRNKAVRITKETTVSLDRRLFEFPKQGLKISAGKLFCLPCKEELPNLKESIKRHIGTGKHRKKLEKFNHSNDAELQMHNDLANYFDANPDAHGVRMCCS